MRLLMLAMFVTVLAACSSTPERHPVPIDQLDTAVVPGLPNVRSWGGAFSSHFQADFAQSIRDEPPDLFPRDPDGALNYAALALSGGGANGAFGAGYLYGWSSAGTRPTFKVVTGISTGALIAPFAFAGPTYDEQLKAVYTQISTKDIMEVRKDPRVLAGTSVADTAPLRNLIEAMVTPEMLADIARVHANGQRLYVGTTHLDAMQLVVWNMGEIASSDHPDALALFQDVLLASASIPVAFPPVIFDVEADGERYDELHVDGGTIAQVFFHGAMLDVPAAFAEATGEARPEERSTLHVIRNGHIGPAPATTEPRLLDIASRSIDAQGRAVLWGNLYQIYATAKRDSIRFRMVGLPDDVELQNEEIFDQEEMNRIFQIGFDMAVAGDQWIEGVPGFIGR